MFYLESIQVPDDRVDITFRRTIDDTLHSTPTEFWPLSKRLLKNMEILFKQHLNKNVYEEDIFSREIPSSLSLVKDCEPVKHVYSITSKKLSRLIEECKICKQHSLCEGTQLREIITKIFSLLCYIFSKYSHFPNLLFRTKYVIILKLILPPNICGHSVSFKKSLVDICIARILNTYCKTINNILS